MYNIKMREERRGYVQQFGLLGRQSLWQLYVGGRLYGLLVFLGLKDVVQLFELSNDVIFDVWSGDLQANVVIVKGSGKIIRKHFIDYASYYWDDLFR